MIFRSLNHSSGIIIFCFVFALLLHGSPAAAQLEEVAEQDLSLVCAQAGISANWGNSQLIITADSIQVSDTDHDPHNWLELNDFSISGPDGYFTLDENVSDPILYQFSTFDVGTMTTIDNKTRTFANFTDATNTYPRTWNIGHLVFCSQDLGSIRFDIRNIDPTIFKVTSHGEGASGYEFEYLSNWQFDNFSYAYAEGKSLSVSGIHIAERASGASDNPADPSTWEFDGRFRVGDLYGGTIDIDDDPGNAAISNPATFDVGTDTSTSPSNTCMFLNLPMKGSIRVENVNIGGTGFGPVAIDGITVHRLGFKFDPGN